MAYHGIYSFELKFIPPDKIVEAVVYADVSYIDCTVGAEDGTYPIDAPYAVLICRVVAEESVLPDVVPNTMDDEPSVVQSNALVPAPQPEPASQPKSEPETAPRRKLPRRATSRASSRAPSPPPVVVPEPVAEEPAAPAPVEEPPQPAPTRRVSVSP